MSVLAAYIWYLVSSGISDMIGFFTLGTTEGDPWLGQAGDDSIIMLLKGILAFLILTAVALLYFSNIRDVKKTEKLIAEGKPIPDFYRSLRIFTDKKFYIIALFLPVIGVVLFNILPIIFMTLISFTNYGGDIVPPKLVDWIGFENFIKVFSLSGIKETFFKILGWNVVWAVCSTLINYFGGVLLALLLNKKCVKGKRFWRVFPILAYRRTFDSTNDCHNMETVEGTKETRMGIEETRSVTKYGSQSERYGRQIHCCCKQSHD